MSKSLKRVQNYLAAAGLDIDVLHMAEGTKTAAMAADAVNCHIDQIAKSIILLGKTSGQVALFLTAGGNRVDEKSAAALVGEQLMRADAAVIRSQTGFAIGGVSPVGHISPIKAYMDQRLLEFSTVWAAAGTPNHMFEIDPIILEKETHAIVADFSGPK